MNRALKRISLACLAMFGLLLLNINYVQAFQSTKLAGEPGNIRVFNQQFQYQRGSIMAAGDGTAHAVIIAQSKPAKGSPGTFRRSYPAGPEYAQITGYDSIYGATALEQTENSELAGTDPRLAVHNLVGLFSGRPKQGATVFTTISAKAQNAAYQALQAQAQSDGGKPAAVVAINPSTGAILAMASYPTYNPNVYTTFNGPQLNRTDKRLRDDTTQPLLNRAITPNYPPGSSFKVVTSSTWLSGGAARSPASTVQAPTVLTLPNGNPLHNDGDETCGNGHPQLIFAFYVSCNTAFGQLGINVGAQALHKQAELFGFNQTLSIPFAVPASEYPLVPDDSLRALSAIGQYNDEVSPFQEAMFAAAIANHGSLETPYLVQSVQAPDLSTIQTTTPKLLHQTVSSQVASEVGSMMLQVTQNPGGTAFQTAGPPAVGSLNIAGKTGTAENGVNNAGLNDAVFTSFAPYSDPKIAVGVIVQGGGFGADAAAPIAVKVIKAYLGQG
ncbi:MAG TPA: penicillin-binding transpeptidase domain-containing protein [Streptosporangiaceae bacterium]